MPPYPHLARAYGRVRRAARRCVSGLTYGAGVALWCAWGCTYTAFGIVFAAAALVFTATLAAVAWAFSGE